MSLPGELVDLDGIRVFYHRRRGGGGARPAVVLLHGYLDSQYTFRALVEPLAERCDVIALDLPGFGESDRPPRSAFAYSPPAFAAIVFALLDRLGVGRARLLAHSLGGAVAIEMALARPVRIDRMALLAPLAYPIRQAPEVRLALMPLIGRFIFYKAYRRADVARALRKQFFGDPALATEDVVDYFWERLNRKGGREAGYEALVEMVRWESAPHRYAEIHCPVLVLWGDRDAVQPYANGQRLAAELPDAKLRAIGGAGHMIQLERSREVLRYAAPFLAEGALAG